MRPDRWNERCPKAAEVSRLEMFDFLKVAERALEAFTAWELDFCYRAMSQIHRGSSLAPGQRDVLDRGLLRKLWDNDPDLWSE